MFQVKPNCFPRHTICRSTYNTLTNLYKLTKLTMMMTNMTMTIRQTTTIRFNDHSFILYSKVKEEKKTHEAK